MTPPALIDHIRSGLARRPRAVDTLLAGGAALFAVSMWRTGTPAEGASRTAAVAVLLLVGAGTLLLRRSHAWLALGLATGAYVGSELLDPAAEGALTVGLVAYAVARYRPAPGSVGAAAVLACAVLLPDVVRPELGLEPEGPPGDGALVAGVFAMAVWLLGATLRRLHTDAARLRELADRLHAEQELARQRAVTAERARIAHELHDLVAHHLSAIALQARATATLLPSNSTNSTNSADGLAAIGAAADTALLEMREILRLLADDRVSERSDRLDGPDPEPALGSLDRLAERARSAGCQVCLEVDGPVATVRPAVQVSAYRIVQEALTNVLRHAGPTDVRITVDRADAELRLLVENGPPVSGHRPIPGSGLGLVGMRERTALYGGVLRTGPTGDGGWWVDATLRCDPPEQRS